MLNNPFLTKPSTVLLEHFRTELIKKQNVGLVIDTNILSDIIGPFDIDKIDQRLADWIHEIILQSNPHPRGKTVTLFINKQILNDYSTGLSRSTGKRISRQALFRKKNIRNRKLVSSDYKIYFSIAEVRPQEESSSRRRLRDKSDEKFLVLLDNILNAQRWRDFAIIMASRDMASFVEISDNVYHVDRVHLADSKDTLSQIIEC